MTQPSYANVLGNHAGGIPFHDPDTGNEYEVSYLTQGKKARFEKWMLAESMKDVMAAREYLDPATFEQALSAATSRPYRFHSTLAQRLLSDAPGLLALSAILFGIIESEMEDLWGRHGQAVMALVNYVLAESRPKGWRDPQGESEGNGQAVSWETRLTEAKEAWETESRKLSSPPTSSSTPTKQTSIGSPPASPTQGWTSPPTLS